MVYSKEFEFFKKGITSSDELNKNFKTFQNVQNISNDGKKLNCQKIYSNLYNHFHKSSKQDKTRNTEKTKYQWKFVEINEINGN